MSDSPRVSQVFLNSRNLYGQDRDRLESLVATVCKTVGVVDQEDSKQGSILGRVAHPVDMQGIQQLKDHNEYHSACLEAKISATVGLGFKSPKIAKTLSPYCNLSFQDVVNEAAADYWEYGGGAIEISRNSGGNIRGVYHLPAPTLFAFVENGPNEFHYEVVAGEVSTIFPTNLKDSRRYARFGDVDNLRARAGVDGGIAGFAAPDDVEIGEVIYLPRSSNRSQHYGYPDWVGCLSSIELDQCLTQYQFDFFFNGGVPEGLFVVAGGKMDDKTWDALETQFKSHQGLGNRRKIMLANLSGENLTIEFIPFTLEGQTTGDHSKLSDANALKVVTAHRVPPLLAGIQIPGKLGANNEMSNSIMGFQTLVIAQAQKQISAILAGTLGDPKLNGDLGLTAADFLGEGTPEMDPNPDPTGDPQMTPRDNKGNGFRTITEEINLGAMDTMSTMRDSASEAKFRGRDLNAGAEERGRDS